MGEVSGRIVIVGGGHGGGSAAAFLRQFGWTGPITLVGEEPIAPYQRPPLSKAWLKGEADADSLALRPAEFYAEAAITLKLGERVRVIDRAERQVILQSGESLSYDALILATGARARRLPLPGVELDGVLELRTAADADRLKTALSRPEGAPPKRLAVIGGGYIGLEAAASARALGAEAVVIEREARVLARVACEPLSTFFQDYHRARGVSFLLNAGVERLEGEGGRVSGVRLTGGELIACDAALVGVGAVPNDELARAAGLACEEGVVVDLDARTSDPAIFAVGDVTRRPMPHYEHRLWRLESVPNALEQAKQAAAHLCCRPAPPHETPWFWSDQFDLKLQIAGLPFDAARTVIRGDATAGEGPARFAVFHLSAEDRVLAVEAVNAPPEFMAGRQLIANRKPVAPDKLRDMSVSMKGGGRLTAAPRCRSGLSRRERMAQITYLSHDGTERTLEVKTGLTVMEGAVKNNVPGIDADCGGACACATCHVYVDEAWTDKVGPASAMEESMLDFAEGVQPNSRLSCQIKVSDALNGLRVTTPESQH